MKSTPLTPTEIMSVSPIIPVIEISDINHSIDLANALIAGGINVLAVSYTHLTLPTICSV